MPLLRPSRLVRTFALVLLAGALAFVVAFSSRSPASATGVQAPAARAAVHGPLIVGLADGAGGFGGASTGPRLNLLQRTTGARWVRDTFWWYRIEPRPGHFDFRYYDHYLLALGRRHMHVVPQLLGAPRWAAPVDNALPAQPGPYAAYVAAVVHRYGPHGTFWRAHPALRGSAVTAVNLWNEPYYSNGDAGHYNPARYARMVRAAGTASHRTDRSVKVLMEADMAIHLYKTWRWWVDSLYQAVPGLNRYFDAVSMHDFGNDVTHLSPIRFGYPYQNFERARRIEDVRRQFVRHRAASKPFWIMEMGWSTCRVAVDHCPTEAGQAQKLATMYGNITTRYRAWVQAVFVYRYQDSPPARSVQDSYGLFRTNGSAKPAASVFRRMTAASG